MRAPDNVGVGNAHATVSFDAWKEGCVGQSEVVVAVEPATPWKPRPVSPQLKATIDLDTGKAVWGLAFHPDGDIVAAADSDSPVVRRWDLAHLREHVAIQTEGGMFSLAYSPDGQTLVTSHFRHEQRRFKENGELVSRNEWDGGITLWDARSGKLNTSLRHIPGRGVCRIALSPDGTTVAAAEVWSEDDGRVQRNQVSLWDVAAGTVRNHLSIDASSIAFACDSPILATASDKVQLWDSTTGKELATLPRPKEHDYPVNSLAFAPDGQTLAGADYRGDLYLWDVPRRTLRLSLKHGEGQHRITGLAFAPDSRTLAGTAGVLGRSESGAVDRLQPQVVFWDAATGEQRTILTAPPGSLVSLVFSPDGKTLATGGVGVVLLWDVADEVKGR